MRLTELMSSKSIRAGRIADRAGLSPSVVSKLLAGQAQPTRTTMEKLVRAFPELTKQGIMLDYLDASSVSEM